MTPEQLRRDRRFAGLQTIKLLLLNSWGDNIVSVPYLLQACPLIETLTLEVSSLTANYVHNLMCLSRTWQLGAGFGGEAICGSATGDDGARHHVAGGLPGEEPA
jgi:hypothetical protein